MRPKIGLSGNRCKPGEPNILAQPYQDLQQPRPHAQIGIIDKAGRPNALLKQSPLSGKPCFGFVRRNAKLADVAMISLIHLAFVVSAVMLGYLEVLMNKKKGDYPDKD